MILPTAKCNSFHTHTHNDFNVWYFFKLSSFPSECLGQRVGTHGSYRTPISQCNPLLLAFIPILLDSQKTTNLTSFYLPTEPAPEPQ